MLGNVYPNSSAAIKAILDLHFPSGGKLIDPTGSKGVFYKKVSGWDIVRGDIRTCVAPDYLGDFRAIPFANDAFDVAVFDPPYKRGSRKTGNTSDHYADRYGVAPNNENAATRQYAEAIAELFRVTTRGVIIKLQDAADGHNFHDRRLSVSKMVEERIGLRPHDSILVYRPSPMKTLTLGRRRFFRQQVSYFLVWKWKRKTPRYVRFSY